MHRILSAALVAAMGTCVSIPAFARATKLKFGEGTSSKQMGETEWAPAGELMSYAFAYTYVPPAEVSSGVIDRGNVAYWIGVQSAGASSTNLVQPVLAWGSDWDCGIANTWFILAYEIDSSGNSRCGSAVAVNPRDEILLSVSVATISLVPSEVTWVITARDVATGGQSQLTTTVPLTNASFFAAAQEWYNPFDCAVTPFESFYSVLFDSSPYLNGAPQSYSSLVFAPNAYASGPHQSRPVCPYGVTSIPNFAGSPVGSIVWTD